MNLKQHLKLKEEEVPYSERDKQFFQSMLEEVERNAQQHSAVIAKRRKKILVCLIPVVSAFLGGIVAVICIFGFKHNNLPPLYQEENILWKDSSFAEMQQDLKYLSFKNIESTANSFILNYDSVTNDSLYYTFKSSDDLFMSGFTVVVNENYDFKFNLGDNSKSEILPNYSLTYSSEENLFDINKVYKGWIKVETEAVYFEYTQLFSFDDEVFLANIQQIIQLK